MLNLIVNNGATLPFIGLGMLVVGVATYFSVDAVENPKPRLDSMSASFMLAGPIMACVGLALRIA